MKTNELRCKITIIFFLLLIYRLGTYIPLSGMSFINIINQSTKGVIHIIYTFTGLNFSRVSILSLGIMPYISSSIFVQFISFAFPFVSLMNRKINFINRLLTILICLFQAPVYIITMTSQVLPFFYMPKAYILDISNNKINFFFFFICIVLLTIGSLFCLWIGEKITDKGIYNGISFIIMTGIIVRFPENIVMEVSNSLELGNIGFILLFLESVIWLIIIYYTLYIIQIVRKVPLQYLNYISNKVNGYIPLKVLSSGMMPIIFSETIMLLTSRLVSSLTHEKFKTFFENIYGIWYNCIYIILMILFTFFYRAIAFPINKIGYDLKRNEAYIPKIKPGKETINILSEIYYNITFPGSLLLAIIAIFPIYLVKLGINRSLSLFYGGTSLLIIVGVILEALQQIHICMHTYNDFITYEKKIHRKRC